jgi:hypothetical protein
MRANEVADIAAAFLAPLLPGAWIANAAGPSLDKFSAAGS